MDSGDRGRSCRPRWKDKSFAAFKARQRGDHAWIESRAAAAMAFRTKDHSNTGDFTWLDEHPHFFSKAIRRASLESLLGKKYRMFGGMLAVL